MEILAARRAAKKFDLFLLDFYLWVKQHVPVKLCIHTYARAARRGTVTSVSIADTLRFRLQTEHVKSKSTGNFQRLREGPKLRM